MFPSFQTSADLLWTNKNEHPTPRVQRLASGLHGAEQRPPTMGLGFEVPNVAAVRISLCSFGDILFGLDTTSATQTDDDENHERRSTSLRALLVDGCPSPPLSPPLVRPKSVSPKPEAEDDVGGSLKNLAVAKPGSRAIGSRAIGRKGSTASVSSRLAFETKFNEAAVAGRMEVPYVFYVIVVLGAPVFGLLDAGRMEMRFVFRRI